MWFDPRVTSYEALLARWRRVEKPSTAFVYEDVDWRAAKTAAGEKAVRTKVVATDAGPADRKYHLRRSAYRFLPLTATQATRVNALLFARKQDPKADPDSVLSPRQQAWLGRIRAAPEGARAKLAELEPARTVAGFRAYEAELQRVLRRR